jgi:gamma-glutamyltranspeptidase / glutathione hydrolase
MARPKRPAFTTRPIISGTFGVVTSTHWLASQVGMLMLEKGGNAFDAAVAASFMLQVVEPHQFGPCGELVAIFQAGGRAPLVLCGQGVAPAAATISHFRDQGIAIVPGTGVLAAVVPGAFDALMLMLRDHGTMRFADVIEPAIGYARDGFPVTYAMSATIAGAEQLFREEWTTSAALYLPGNQVPQPGEIFANRDLATTYARLLAEANAVGGDRERQIEAARTAFCRGFIAEAIDSFVADAEAMDVSGRRHKGVLTGADLATWQATYEEPASYDYHGLTVCKPGAWSQGPVFLQILALLKGYDVAGMDAAGPQFAHILIEAMKLAFADRDAWYGDVSDVPLVTLLGDAYNEARRKSITEQASLELRPGSPDGRSPRLPAHLFAKPDRPARSSERAAKSFVPGPGPAWQSEIMSVGERNLSSDAVGDGRRAEQHAASSHRDTCHIDVIDRHGNVVAVTPSGGFLHQSPSIPNLGICLNSRAQTFLLEEGLPSSLAPGRRPRTTLSPTLTLRDGEAVLAFGSPGADNQDQWLLQFFLHHVQHGFDLQAAIDAPALQTDHVVSSFHPRGTDLNKAVLESRFPEATVAELKRRGHNVKLTDAWSSFGRICAAAKANNLLHAAATPRLQQAYAVGR